MSDHDLAGRSRHRGRSRLAPLLAIFALLVQFVAGFGHFHPEDLQDLTPGTAATVPADSRASTVPAPVDHGPALPTHDDCAICIALGMAGSAALPETPVLVVAPHASVATVPRPLAERRVAWPPYFLFDSRGPPHA